MRDIRGDLQERGNVIEQQMNAAQRQFEQLLEQLKREQDSKLGDLEASELLARSGQALLAAELRKLVERIELCLPKSPSLT
jgi:hypothetical protein